MTATTFVHGLTGYTKHRCRCPVCTTARSDYDVPRKAQLRAQAKADAEAERRARLANHPTTLAMEHLYAAGWTPVQVSSLFWWTPEEVRACAASHGNRWADVRPAVELLVEAMALPHERR